MTDPAKPEFPTCHICGHSRRGAYCPKCEQWVCFKHQGRELYWQPGRRLCDHCSALPFGERPRLSGERPR